VELDPVDPFAGQVRWGGEKAPERLRHGVGLQDHCTDSDGSHAAYDLESVHCIHVLEAHGYGTRQIGPEPVNRTGQIRETDLFQHGDVQ
jgi:hypothetical protein